MVTVNIDMATSPSTNGALGAGWKGVGSLTIQNGVTVVLLAAISATGTARPVWRRSRDPALPGTVDDFYAGYSGSGTLSITNGGSVSSRDGYIGYASGSTGAVTVDGTARPGPLTASMSAIVAAGRSPSPMAAASRSPPKPMSATGGFHRGDPVRRNGGTLTTFSLLASPAQLAGTGTINTCGLVSDVNLTFDASHNLQQTLMLQQSGQNITVNLDMSGGVPAAITAAFSAQAGTAAVP